ncbi:uncharacterized protein C8A04DRAFT_30258 [Dichotomopilus funicola]|uniref:Uncharacterized protein n=1 Tax=Dichotomopilus funicola TaxID=1934379 RepID=A0AAN6UZK5_9PEZI|nr:hypothetical protein C8A04DRAFT_30258 [Dichotomopilus funicola]
MKGLFKTAVAAALVLGAVAQPHVHGHGHGHSHLHSKKHAQAIEKRGGKVIVTEVVEGPTVVVYVDGTGKKVESAEAEKGLKKGDYYVVGSTKPSFSSPPPVSSTSLASPDHGGQFFEKTSSSTSSTPTTSSKPPPPPPSSTKPVEEALPTGLDAEFPSGKVPCNKLPTQYGAVPVPGTTTDGWATLAAMGTWAKGVAFNNFKTAISGGCTTGMMCSYACPPGYEKTQWPEEQGATGQSVGGLWCNSDGMLELTRKNATRICAPGAGGVSVRNELPKNAAICRTDYPGNEAMVIPLNTLPGSTYPLTNPDSKTSYWWQGAPTTAQYYVNNAGVGVEDACTWQSPNFPDSAGNWAPVNIGVGLSLTGETFISIFPNLPTSTALLNFNIEIQGDISGTCWLRGGKYYGSDKGCTVGLKAGGKAVIVLSL